LLIMLLKDKEDTQDKQDTCKKEAARAVQTKQEIQDKGTSKKYKAKNRTMI